MTIGLKFPLTFHNGRTLLIEDEAKVSQNIQHIVQTFFGEREYEPSIGVPSYLNILRNINYENVYGLIKIIDEEIKKQEPRVRASITYNEDESKPEQGMVVFNVDYIYLVNQSLNNTKVILGG